MKQVPRIFLLISSGFVLLQTLTCCTEERDPKLNSIIAAYQKREDSDDSVQAHLAWLKSDTGRDEAEYLAEHYDDLTREQRLEIPTKLAQTGQLPIVPLLKKGLADRENDGMAISGLFYADMMGEAKTEFRHAIAPDIVPWIANDLAFDLLRTFDADLATRTFLKDEFLSVDATQVHKVLFSLNNAGEVIPLPQIRKMLQVWEVSALDTKAEYRVRAGYREAVRALALHNPGEALDIAERIVQKSPLESENYDEIPLIAAGLTSLYEKLYDHADEPAEFAKLPEAAQIYFAITSFEVHWNNGGIGEALSNSTGDYVSTVKKGYQVIGNTRSLQLVEWMCKPFGSEGPSPDQTQRNTQMESMKPSYWEQEEALWEAGWKQAGDQPRISTSWLLNLYAAKNAAILKPFVKEAIR